MCYIVVLHYSSATDFFVPYSSSHKPGLRIQSAYTKTSAAWQHRWPQLSPDECACYHNGISLVCDYSSLASSCAKIYPSTFVCYQSRDNQHPTMRHEERFLHCFKLYTTRRHAAGCIRKVIKINYVGTFITVKVRQSGPADVIKHGWSWYSLTDKNCW